MKENSAKLITWTALMTAITFVLTFFIEIPIPLGYANLGSTAILMGAVILDFVPGIIAGAVGAALADLLLGYAYWCVPTLIIKGMMVVLYVIIAGNKKRKLGFRTAFGAIISNAWAAIAYMVAGMILYGSVETGLLSGAGLSIESVINCAIFLALLKAFEKGQVYRRIRM